MRDMFGNELFVGDTVVYADATLGMDKITLDMYEITEIDGDVVMGELRSGEYMGNEFYLVDTPSRCALIRNPYKAVDAYQSDTLH